MPNSLKSLPKGNVQQMKEYNRALVLRLIQQAGPISRVELAKRTGLSPTTVSVITDGLIQDGLVHEVDDAPASIGAGRRPVLLEIHPGGAYFIGIDLGVTNTSVVLFDLVYQARARRTAPTPKGEGVSASIELVLRFVHEVLQEAGVSPGRVAGVGLGVPGYVDSIGGISRVSHNLGWHDVPFGGILQEALGVPVFVENVIRMTTLAEKWLGAGRGVSDLICVGVGSGVGAGVVIGERLYRGPGQGAGEIGHTVLLPGGPLCRCGRRGCLEALVSGSGIVARTLDRLKAGEASRLRSWPAERLARLTAQEIAELAHQGDRLCREIFRETGVYLGLGIANMINLFDIPYVIVGGGITQAGELLFEPVDKTVREHVYAVDPQRITIVPRKLGGDAGLLGAALLASMETVFKLPRAVPV